MVLVNAALLAAIAAVIVLVQVVDRHSPAVDRTVRRYAAAMAAQDLEGARAEVAPHARDAWTWFIAEQLGNIYDVTAVSVRSPSVLDRLLRGAPGLPFEATVRMDVNRGYPELFYQPTERVGLHCADGRWYLAAPLLAPDQR